MRFLLRQERSSGVIARFARRLSRKLCGAAATSDTAGDISSSWWFVALSALFPGERGLWLDRPKSLGDSSAQGTHALLMFVGQQGFSSQAMSKQLSSPFKCTCRPFPTGELLRDSIAATVHHDCCVSAFVSSTQEAWQPVRTGIVEDGARAG